MRQRFMWVHATQVERREIITVGRNCDKAKYLKKSSCRVNSLRLHRQRNRLYSPFPVTFKDLVDRTERYSGNRSVVTIPLFLLTAWGFTNFISRRYVPIALDRWNASRGRNHHRDFKLSKFAIKRIVVFYVESCRIRRIPKNYTNILRYRFLLALQKCLWVCCTIR